MVVSLWIRGDSRRDPSYTSFEQMINYHSVSPEIAETACKLFHLEEICQEENRSSTIIASLTLEYRWKEFVQKPLKGEIRSRSDH